MEENVRRRTKKSTSGVQADAFGTNERRHAKLRTNRQTWGADLFYALLKKTLRFNIILGTRITIKDPHIFANRFPPKIMRKDEPGQVQQLDFLASIQGMLSSIAYRTWFLLTISNVDSFPGGGFCEASLLMDNRMCSSSSLRRRLTIQHKCSLTVPQRYSSCILTRAEGKDIVLNSDSYLDQHASSNLAMW